MQDLPPHKPKGLVSVKLKDIATLVGVSSATVSRVLNFDQSLSVSLAVRQAIVETAEAMNYATPRNRKSAPPQTTSKIALVHFLRPEQELADPYYVALRIGIERRCAALKIETVKIYHTDAMPDPKQLRATAGVIAIGLHAAPDIDWLKQHSRFLVFADYVPQDEDIDSVAVDRPLAMQKLLRALTDLQYRKIGFIGWWDYVGGAKTWEERSLAYVRFMQELGCYDPELCLFDSNTEQGGYALTKRLLALGPDAIIAGNDNMAVGAYRAIHEAGLTIPGDIAIASFNDISVAQFLSPPLTTVRLPSEVIGESAVDLLLERIQGRSTAKRATMVSKIIWRGSVRKP